ncbi:hypothetical protein INS49_009045 [Diaporthe citri]|uniref:uncharacterized protein n=1 Tax=Diaporthe citri TaxID=83186 RepID=UPI001C8137BD|nr:uncharacterized protein INS49_009045 [Diaporthe citri]KAG6363942.1 hypothetical protein INS49_009045 [Diaporthe citri]
MPFTYTDLATPESIRLIQVMPEKIDNVIALTIHTYDAQELQQAGHNTSYRALSYRWGNPESKTPHVYLRDAEKAKWHLHPVHENLWQFINHVWQCQWFDDLFWTDYFCLNQSSAEEKSQQIPRMGIIYSGAAEVIIWLGLSEDEERQIEFFLEHLKKNGTCYGPEDDETTQIIEGTVTALCKNPYWSRLWIIQEVTLAKRAVVMMRSRRIDFEDLESATLKSRGGWPDFDPPSLSDLRYLRLQQNNRQLGTLLKTHVARNYQCREPNDRVFGLIGLLDPPNDFLRVDYTRAYSHVILDAILESGADMSHQNLPGVLDSLAQGDPPLRLTTNPNELEEYLSDQRTSQRHRELASAALQAFDSMSLIMTVESAPQSRSHINKTHFELCDNRALGVQNGAAFLGFSLVFGSSEDWASSLLQNWETWRQHKLQTQPGLSRWRCVAHQTEEHMSNYTRQYRGEPSREDYMEEFQRVYMRSFCHFPLQDAFIKCWQREWTRRHGGSFPMEEYMHAYTLFRTKKSNHHAFIRSQRAPANQGRETALPRDSSWNPEDIKKACGKANEDCDGSGMILEIPHTSFRLIVSEGRKMRLDLNLG